MEQVSKNWQYGDKNLQYCVSYMNMDRSPSRIGPRRWYHHCMPCTALWSTRPKLAPSKGAVVLIEMTSFASHLGGSRTGCDHQIRFL